MNDVNPTFRGLPSAAVLAAAVLLTGCSEATPDTVLHDDRLSISVTTPADSSNVVTGCPTIFMEGTASVNVDWFRCCPAEDGSVMSAENETTGESIPVSSFVEYAFFATRKWSLRAPLAPGANRIRIYILDASGNRGSETVIVTRSDTALCSP